MTRLVLLLLVLALVATACAGASDGDSTASEGEPTPAPPPITPAPPPGTSAFPPPPAVPDGPVTPETLAILDRVFAAPLEPDLDAVAELAQTGDPRVLWLVSDLLRFVTGPDDERPLREAAEILGGLDLSAEDFAWGPVTDHLLAWDLPAPDNYVHYKARLFTAIERGWTPFFEDADATIDWRQVSWGGVLIDNRPFGDPNPCLGGCIPSLDDPALVPADEGDYYPDDRIVFGVIIGDDVVAFPKNLMEIHEMVNMTLGGRQIAMPYCTLCGAAQVFFTDVEGGGTGEIVMRTSGLLRRSNKVMYDLTTESVFDTFTGEAVTGPLREAGITLEQAPVVTSRWGDWKDAHPETLIVAGDGGIGRTYPLDPLRGRDDNGPIFPIGEVDPRLPVQEQVLGVETADGTFIAFPVRAAREVLAAGGVVESNGVSLQEDGTGVIALVDGEQVPAHQAFWFAWSQFHPDTVLWGA